MDKAATIIEIGNIGGSSALGNEESNDSLCPTLSYKNRLIGCVFCIAMSSIFSILSWASIFTGDYIFFGVLFTLSNLLSMGGTLFLAGPQSQLKRMFDEGRIIATCVFFASMVATILVAVLLHNAGLVILCGLFQLGASWWYFLSYIPFARDAIIGAVKSLCGR